MPFQTMSGLGVAGVGATLIAAEAVGTGETAGSADTLVATLGVTGGGTVTSGCEEEHATTKGAQHHRKLLFMPVAKHSSAWISSPLRPHLVR